MSSYSDSFRNVTSYTGQGYRFVPTYIRPRDPFSPTSASSDIRPKEQQGKYVVCSLWNNSVNGNIWALAKITNNLANWVLISSGGSGPLLMVAVPAGTSPISPDVNGLLNFTSTLGTITITGSAGGVGAQNINFDLSGGGVAVDQIHVDAFTAPGTQPVVPTAAGQITVTGAQVASGVVGTNVIRTDSLAANTYTVEIQRSTAVAATDITKNGVSHFNSTQFTVDANAFVSVKGGAGPVLQTVTGDDTVIVSPDASGNINLQGLVVANATHAKAVFTESPGANTEKIDIQVAAAIAATDVTKVGLAAFHNTHFSVDVNGFVDLNGAGVGETITGDSGGALSPTAGNWNIFGLSGSKTSGAASTLTIKSPPYSDQGGSTTVTLNSGSFATAAITLTLPVSAGLADGDLFEFVCTTAGALVIQAVGAQEIRIGSLISSAAGTATSTAIGDSLSLRFRATDGFFYTTSVIGTWVVA